MKKRKKAVPKRKLEENRWSKLTKAKVILVLDKSTMISGEGFFTAFKTLPKGGEAVFNITLVKKL